MLLRALCLLFALIGLSPAYGQAPPAVPALPDSARLTSYSISGTNCACNVNFQLYGNPGDNQFQDYLEVYLNGVAIAYNDATYGWTITSPTGPLATIPRPITDAILTFTNTQTGTVQIVGARRPSRTTQFTEGRGVAARDLNQAITDIIAMLREDWDKINDVTGRVLMSQPGNVLAQLPTPASCASSFLGFDSTGLIPLCFVSAPIPNANIAASSVYANASGNPAPPQAVAIDNTLHFAGSPLKLGLASNSTSVDGVACGLGSTCSLAAQWGLQDSGTGPGINTTNPPYSNDLPINMGLAATVSGNALTVSLKTAAGAAPSASSPVLVPFGARTTSQPNGQLNWTLITGAKTVVVPSSATLGIANNNTPFRIWVFLAYNAGTPELGVATCSAPGTIYGCAVWESAGVTTVSISSGSTAGGTCYTPVGVSGDTVRIIGYIDYNSGLGTAGVWATNPTLVELATPLTPRPGQPVYHVTANTTTGGTTASASYAALSSGQSQAITLTSPVDLIHIMLTGTGDSSQCNIRSFVQIARGSTLIGNPTEIYTLGASGECAMPVAISIYDSPGASATYNLYGKIAGGNTLTYPASNTGSLIDLEEIMGALEPANDNAPMRKAA